MKKQTLPFWISFPHRFLIAALLSLLLSACVDDPVTGASNPQPTSAKTESDFELASADQSTQILSGDDLEEFSLIRSESLGGLKLDMHVADFEPLLPCTVEKGEPVLWAGIGEIIQEWHYQDCGVKLQLSTVGPETPQIISSIMVREPSEFETAQGIQVGSSEEDVMIAYADYLDADNSVPGDTLVAGSIYGGIIFTLKDDRVDSIFLGAGAE